jgi:hypothetical protein
MENKIGMVNNINELNKKTIKIASLLGAVEALKTAQDTIEAMKKVVEDDLKKLEDCDE